jgi:hypothetical protein
MSDLITRLEAATGPSFTLEKEILRAVNPNASMLSVPNNYTSSLDAALTLVPEGWQSYTADFSIEGRARWSLQGTRTQWRTNDDGDKEPGDDWYAMGIGSTPALAICIAALRARGEP